MINEIRTVIITGGLGSIGLDLVSFFYKKNFNIIILDNKSKKEYSKLKIKDTNVQNTISYYKIDLSKPPFIKKIFNKLKVQYKKIHVLINCAGTYGSIGKFYNLDFKNWKKAIEVNFFGTFLMCKYFLKLLKKSKIKKIINFSGGGAFYSFPNYSSYATSKAALVRFTETIADELKLEKILVNCIAPGFVSTNIHKKTIKSGPKSVGKIFYSETLSKLKEGGTPFEKIFKCVSFLISKESKSLTGKTISVNFDPWNKKKFQKNINKLKDSDELTMRRINLMT